MTNQLSAGDTAPEFTLNDAEGVPLSLSDYADRNVIVYFYPKAGTPGCTTEACDFRDNLGALDSAGYDVIGISPDDEMSIAEFAGDQQLTFPLLSDPDAEVAKEYGTYGDMDIGGKTIQGVLRSTFVVGPDGVLKSADYSVDADGHVAELRERLGV